MDTEYDLVRTVHDGRFQYVRNYMPDLPLYQDIKYRLSIPMMKRMLQMRDSGLLNTTQMIWFKKTKPAEELYDLKNDRYELNNLADNPLYKKDLIKLRTALNNWLKETGDANATPEKELVKRMWQGKDAPPQTDTPPHY